MLPKAEVFFSERLKLSSYLGIMLSVFFIPSVFLKLVEESLVLHTGPWVIEMKVICFRR